MYLWIMGLFISIRLGCVSFISPLLNHLLHHLQLTRVWCGSALKALKQNETVIRYGIDGDV